MLLSTLALEIVSCPNRLLNLLQLPTLLLEILRKGIFYITNYGV